MPLLGQFLLPMRLERLGDGRYVVLNRHYKPVGTYSRKRVDYEASGGPITFSRQLTAQDAKLLSVGGDEDLNTIVLYDEAANPLLDPVRWQDYLRRLDYLLNLEIEALK